MPTCIIDTHQEDPDDGSGGVSWPAASGFTVNAGDYILANRGVYTSYTSTDGTVTITFGSTYSPGSWGTSTGTYVVNGTTYSYQGPYTSVGPGTIDLTDAAFADIEILSTVDYYVDPNTNEYPHHPRSGQFPIHGLHIRPSAITGGVGGTSLDHITAKHLVKRHHHRHHPGRHHWHGVVFQPVSIGVANRVSIGWSAGVFMEEGLNTNIQSIAASSGTAATNVDTAYQTGDATTGTPPQLLANVNQYIIFNNSGASITFPCTGNSITQIAVANKAFGAIDSYDATLAANDEVYLIGRVSSSTDQNTGSYWIHGWHAGSHQHHGIHLPKKALSADKMISVNSPGGSNAAANQVPLADGSGGVTWGTAPGASGMTNPMTSPGDMIYGGTAGAATRLPAGSVSGQVLRYNAATNIPTWGYPPRIQDGTTGNNLQIKNTGYALANGTTNAPTISNDQTSWTHSTTNATPTAGVVTLTNGSGSTVSYTDGVPVRVCTLSYSSASYTNIPAVMLTSGISAGFFSAISATASSCDIYFTPSAAYNVSNNATLVFNYHIIGCGA